MKVKDLIERLQEMNPEAVVHIYDPDFGGFAAVVLFTTVKEYF